MRTDKLDVHDAVVIVDMRNQSISVTSNVENHAVVTNEARVPIGLFDVLRPRPGSLDRFSKPANETSPIVFRTFLRIGREKS